ncbi:twin-arginine translocase TatA/TatE family subunit [Acetobacteraceae bacterium ESL0709]|nr:twin-arginine translocase TatA/TatE family subunit [Acetobacteraceae bacterium ESL0697]MDF7678494.1 twin-arginine translocase TatA/TatE family subunit [Acetobacteraceae bacterium ESL0709]
MGGLSIYHWIILAIVVLVLFGGGGKISSLMGDFAKGIKSFKKSMAEDDSPTPDVKVQQAPIAPPQNVASQNVASQAPAAAPQKSDSAQDARMADETSSRSVH